jgi:hypothetical protein
MTSSPPFEGARLSVVKVLREKKLRSLVDYARGSVVQIVLMRGTGFSTAMRETSTRCQAAQLT